METQAVRYAALAADQDAAIPAAANLRLLGFAAKETAAGAATFNIMHGATVGTGTAIAPVVLAANGKDQTFFGERGIGVPNGVSIDRLAGTADVYLYYGYA